MSSKKMRSPEKNLYSLIDLNQSAIEKNEYWMHDWMDQLDSLRIHPVILDRVESDHEDFYYNDVN